MCRTRPPVLGLASTYHTATVLPTSTYCWSNGTGYGRMLLGVNRTVPVSSTVLSTQYLPPLTTLRVRVHLCESGV